MPSAFLQQLGFYLQLVSMVVGIIWPIVLVVILILAYKDFHRISKKVAPKSSVAPK